MADSSNILDFNNVSSDDSLYDIVDHVIIILYTLLWILNYCHNTI